MDWCFSQVPEKPRHHCWHNLLKKTKLVTLDEKVVKSRFSPPREEMSQVAFSCDATENSRYNNESHCLYGFVARRLHPSHKILK